MSISNVFKPLRQWLNSTRPRILVWYFLLTTFSSVTSILVTHHILYEQIRDQSQEYVSRQVQLFQQRVKALPPENGLSPERQTKALIDRFLLEYEPVDRDDYAIALVKGQVYRHTDSFPQQLLSQEPALIQSWANLNRTTTDSAYTVAGELFYIAQPIVVNGQTQGVLVIVHCADSVFQVVDSALLLIIPATLGIMSIAAAIAWITAGRVLSPLRTLTKTAQSITETDMTQRMTVEGTDDVAKLATTFNEMLDRLQTAFESQQEFLKDAGHELRTPIIALRIYVRIVFEGSIDTITEVLKLIPPLSHPVLEHTPPAFNLV